MGKQALTAAPRFELLFGVILLGMALALTGCGLSGPATAIAPVTLYGTVHGGQHPVSGSSVQLYAAGNSGVGSTAVPLLSNPVQSDNDGNFTIPASYICPSASSQLYVAARGGNPGLSSGADNPALALATVLGSCGSLSASTPVYVNEVTTVGSVWPLAAYMKSPTEIGSASNDPDFLAAVSSVNQFIDPANGTSPGTATAASYFNQSSKLYSLADVLARCVESAGGSAGDGSPCGMLFSLATPSGVSFPTDTMTAAMRIAQNPNENVTGIYEQVAAPTFFQPVLTAAPANWTLKLSQPVAAPSISLSSGTYVGSQDVTISDATAGSTIYYTTNGTVSTTSSPVYSGALTIAASTTIEAIAVVNGSQSSVSSSTLTITGAAPGAPPVSMAITPVSVTLTPSQMQAFTATVGGTPNTAVTWSLSPALGSISATGLYTAPATVPSPGTVTITATSVSNPANSVSASGTIVPRVGNTYYLAPAAAGGNDSNSGTSASTPWLTPNHPVNCGDVILAAPSTIYSYVNFTAGKWGAVTCTGGPNVAWLKCITFDACKITTSGANSGIYVDSSYWGVQGWEVSMKANSSAGCFYAVPSYITHAPVHHIVFANNVANGCYADGFGSGISGKASADYVAIVGNIAYNAAAGTYCYSNIDVYQPINYDTLPGTHIYIAGNFSFGALNTPNCNSGYPATDGEGINIDTLDGSQSGVGPYTQQVVVDNNLVIGNGGRGIEVENNSICSTCAHVYLRQNTMWGDSTDNTQTGNQCAEQQITKAYNVDSFYNLSVPDVATSCNGQRVYAYQVTTSPTTTDQAYNDWGYSSFGNNSNISGSTGFSFGPNNTFGSNPSFANAVAPGAPSCGSYASVPACMAILIANFTPTNAAARSYGYQIPTSTPVYDPLFPQWLCNVNLPSGLVTMGCQTSQQ